MTAKQPPRGLGETRSPHLPAPASCARTTCTQRLRRPPPSPPPHNLSRQDKSHPAGMFCWHRGTGSGQAHQPSPSEFHRGDKGGGLSLIHIPAQPGISAIPKHSLPSGPESGHTRDIHRRGQSQSQVRAVSCRRTVSHRWGQSQPQVGIKSVTGESRVRCKRTVRAESVTG